MDVEEERKWKGIQLQWRWRRGGAGSYRIICYYCYGDDLTNDDPQTIFTGTSRAEAYKQWRAHTGQHGGFDTPDERSSQVVKGEAIGKQVRASVSRPRRAYGNAGSGGPAPWDK